MGLDGIPGAVLHVDDDHEVTACNDRCQVVFETDSEALCGKHLTELRTEGLFDTSALEKWQTAIEDVQGGVTGETTRRLTLTPSEGTEHSYRLEVRPGVADRPDDEVRCSLRSVGTGQRYNDTLTALHGATRDLMAAEHCDEVLERTADAASDVLEFPGTAVRKYDPDRDVLEHVSLGASVNDIESRPPYPVGDSPHGTAFERGETVIDDIGEDDPYDRGVFSQTMYIPIGEVGLLSVGTVGRTFEETDVQFAEILAENAAAAIEVVETTETLREERERLDLLKQILTRVLRHNIRNDVNVIKGNLDLALARSEGDTGPIERAIDHTEGIVELSEKARELQKIIDSPTTRTRLDLERVVEGAAVRMARQFPDATFEVDVDSAHVLAHETLDLAIENLVENACEHADGSPTISITTADEGERIRLDIADGGPGMSQEEIAVLESKDESELWHGSGVGLWIVRLVVDRCEGTVDFETGPDGTSVSIRLTRA